MEINNAEIIQSCWSQVLTNSKYGPSEQLLPLIARMLPPLERFKLYQIASGSKNILKMHGVSDIYEFYKVKTWKDRIAILMGLNTDNDIPPVTWLQGIPLKYRSKVARILINTREFTGLQINWTDLTTDRQIDFIETISWNRGEFLFYLVKKGILSLPIWWRKLSGIQQEELIDHLNPEYHNWLVHDLVASGKFSNHSKIPPKVTVLEQNSRLVRLPTEICNKILEYVGCEDILSLFKSFPCSYRINLLNIFGSKLRKSISKMYFTSVVEFISTLYPTERLRFLILFTNTTKIWANLSSIKERFALLHTLPFWDRQLFWNELLLDSKKLFWGQISTSSCEMLFWDELARFTRINFVTSLDNKYSRCFYDKLTKGQIDDVIRAAIYYNQLTYIWKTLHNTIWHHKKIWECLTQEEKVQFWKTSSSSDRVTIYKDISHHYPSDTSLLVEMLSDNELEELHSLLNHTERRELNKIINPPKTPDWLEVKEPQPGSYLKDTLLPAWYFRRVYQKKIIGTNERVSAQERRIYLFLNKGGSLLWDYIPENQHLVFWRENNQDNQRKIWNMLNRAARVNLLIKLRKKEQLEFSLATMEESDGSIITAYHDLYSKTPRSGKRGLGAKLAVARDWQMIWKSLSIDNRYMIINHLLLLDKSRYSDKLIVKVWNMLNDVYRKQIIHQLLHLHSESIFVLWNNNSNHQIWRLLSKPQRIMWFELLSKIGSNTIYFTNQEHFTNKGVIEVLPHYTWWKQLGTTSYKWVGKGEERRRIMVDGRWLFWKELDESEREKIWQVFNVDDPALPDGRLLFWRALHPRQQVLLWNELLSSSMQEELWNYILDWWDRSRFWFRLSTEFRIIFWKSIPSNFLFSFITQCPKELGYNEFVMSLPVHEKQRLGCILPNNLDTTGVSTIITNLYEDTQLSVLRSLNDDQQTEFFSVLNRIELFYLLTADEKFNLWSYFTTVMRNKFASQIDCIEFFDWIQQLGEQQTIALLRISPELRVSEHLQEITEKYLEKFNIAFNWQNLSPIDQADMYKELSEDERKQLWVTLSDDAQATLWHILEKEEVIQLLLLLEDDEQITFWTTLPHSAKHYFWLNLTDDLSVLVNLWLKLPSCEQLSLWKLVKQEERTVFWDRLKSHQHVLWYLLSTSEQAELLWELPVTQRLKCLTAV